MLTSANLGSRGRLAYKNAEYISTFWCQANLANLFPRHCIYMGKIFLKEYEKVFVLGIRVNRLARLALEGKALVKQALFDANLERFEVSGRVARLA